MTSPATLSMPDPIVARLEKAEAALAECRDVPDAKKVAALARAAEVYARRANLGREVIDHAHAIVIRAQTLMGRMLKRAEKNTGGRPEKKTGSRSEPVLTAAPTLADIGISKRESSDMQALADLEETAPELHAQVEAGKTTVSKARVEVRRREKHVEMKAKAAANAGMPNDWQIVTGDCLAEIPRLAEQPRLIFADPPYNIGIDYGEGQRADRRPKIDYLAWCDQWIRACHAALTDDGSLWVLINHENEAYFDLMLRHDVLINAGEPAAGGLPRGAFVALTDTTRFHVRSWVTWYETFGTNCTEKFNRTSRRLFHCVKDPNRFVFHADAVNRISIRQMIGDKRANPWGKCWDDVWHIDRVPGTAAERIADFPTQLPLDLLRPVIGCASDPGDLVFDPFSGSGTTGEAAIELGRHYVGIEQSATFADLSWLRLKGVTPAAAAQQRA